MSVSLKVVGKEKLDTVAARLVREANRFQRRVSSATRSAVDRGYRPVLTGMVPAFMPGGYAPALTADLKIATTVRFTGAAPGVTVRVTAPTGGSKGRQVRTMEDFGVLRHPLFGNKKHWYSQRIRRGFASTPLKAIRPQIVREIDAELAGIKRDVERG